LRLVYPVKFLLLLFNRGLKSINPGRILKREITARKLSANKFALALRVPSGRITQILNENRTAFILFGNQDPSIASFFIITFRLSANIMIHHHAAFSPKSSPLSAGFASGQIIFHYCMGFFTFTASFMQPVY
jgi:hypothetical protein